jgi:gas vesicle protein
MANNEGSDLACGLILGALIGAAVALILAPQPGDKTRGLLKTKADEWSVKAKDAYHEAATRGKEVAAKAGEKLQARFEKEKAEEPS